MQTSILAFDSEARLLWASYLPAGYPGGEGAHPWDFVEPGDVPALKKAVRDCLDFRRVTVCEARWSNCGTWRVWFYPVHGPRSPAVIAAESFAVPPGVKALNDRERAVCQLITIGFTEERIAEALGVSTRTVREAKHSAAAAIGIPTHELCVWCGAHQRFLEPL